MLWVYSATLAYIVDSNVGRATSAVAVNSLARGLFAFVASESAQIHNTSSYGLTSSAQLRNLH